ncbi:MAG: DUF711 family protein [Opitutaceae bacterium]
MKSTTLPTTSAPSGLIVQPRPSRNARIRAITAGIDPAGSEPEQLGRRLSDLYETATRAFSAAGFEVQTRRLTLPPVRVSNRATRFSVWNQLATVTRAAESAKARWLCLPFVMDGAKHAEEWRLAAVEVVRRFPRTFVNFIIAENGEIYQSALPEVAQAVLDISQLSANGFDNFRVGAGCNLVANTPFFPFSYHAGEAGFSLAVEIIESVLQALEALPCAASLDDKRASIITTLEEIVREVDAIGCETERTTGFQYKGLDISIAPFPDQRRSIGVLFGHLGIETPGHTGTVAVTSFFTNILKTVIRITGVRATGFNGVMFAPLEDTGLAAAGRAKLLSIDKLLQWSTVCGCGIDMVPVPGSVMREELAALMLDTASISSVLKKPLGVRVLPIPGADVNELTNFNHDFLVNTRIFPVNGQNVPLGGSLSGNFNYLSP